MGEIAEAADGLGEAIVGIWQVGHPKLAQRDRELDVLAGQRRLAIVGREGQRERPLLVLDHALERLLEAGDHAVGSQPEGVALGRAAFEWHAVTPPDEADDRVVALLGAATLDRDEAGVLLAELFDDALDLLVVDLVDVDAEGVVGVGAELDLRSDGQHDAVGGPLAFDEADPLRLRDAQDVEVPLRDGLHDRRLVEVLLGVVVDGIGSGWVGAADAEGPFEHRPRHLAWAEARHACAAPKVADGLVDGALDGCGRKLDVEDDGALVGRRGGDVHRRRV